MPRRNQDIPIRPRYGIPDETSNEEESKEMTEKAIAMPTKPRRTSTSMASSYSEIPFLAQYPGAVPDHVLNDITPTESKDVPQDDSLEEEDSAEENSKDSSCEASKTPKRPNSLQCDSSFPYELEGAGSTETEMRHFVAENLEEKLRTGSPLNRKDQFSDYTSHNSTPSTSTTGMLTRQFFQQSQQPQIDANVLSDIEIEAQYLASAVDNLTENLCNLLHSISSITADNVEVHKNAVNKLTDSMDANIKCMYTIMAKTEEITKSMKPSEQLGQRIREIKRLVDMLENTM